MIELYTKRLYCKTMMYIFDGQLQEYCNNNLEQLENPLINLTPKTGLESCFRFYDIENIQKEICSIAITRKRGKFEICYETHKEFQKRGYITEALKMLIKWIFDHTSHTEIWAIPTTDISERILRKNQFKKFSPYKQSKFDWYVLSKKEDNS